MRRQALHYKKLPALGTAKENLSSLPMKVRKKFLSFAAKKGLSQRHKVEKMLRIFP
jgi:phage-related protein